MIPKFLKLFVRVEWRKYNFSFHSKIRWTRRGRRRQLEVHTCWKRKSNVILRGTWRNAELTPGTGLLPVASYKLHSHRWPSRPSWQIFLHWQPFLPNLLLAVTGSDCRNVRCQSSTSPVSTRLRLNPAAESWRRCTFRARHRSSTDSRSAVTHLQRRNVENVDDAK